MTRSNHHDAMAKTSFLAAALLLFAPLASRAEDPKLMALAESTGAYGGALLFECYLGLAQAEQQVVKSKDAVPPVFVALHLADLGIVKTYDEKLRVQFKDDASFIGFLDKMKEAAIAIHAQGEALQAYMNGSSASIDAVRKKHAAAKKLLVPLLSLPDDGKTIP
jgi:hypothetical protein